ncbi:DEAD/DEAH box helicase [Lutispora sp.]|uniref:DEAD/DEAH box helicase n=1 Tax=Lutispora sp. TaxID=2828727 RepID=UPI002B20922A|nr:DEAD/DEAH box helicase [Lutispora sp.]MEA4961249.1 DEAD/DEAH box helicase [Lutispora sp.]
MKWAPGDVIIIDTQTGSGKTHFVLNTLLPYVSSLNERILYLSNRSALREQISLTYDTQYAPFILSETYQKFSKTWDFVAEGYNFSQAKYLVMDEAHYFLDDTQFNADILSCLERVKEGKNRHINIFMTATSTYLLLSLNTLSFFEPRVEFPEIPYLNSRNLDKYSGINAGRITCSALLKYKELLSPKHRAFDAYIDEFEDTDLYNDPGWFDSKFKTLYDNFYGEYSSHFRSIFSQYLARREDAIKQIHFYNSGKDYSYVNPRYYHDNSELVEKIKESSEDEQWLIFTSSLDGGQDFRAQCLEHGILDVVFVSSKSKNSSSTKDGAALKHIIKYNCFKNKVLIATKVLDNGVNLIDPIDALETMPSPEDCKYKYLNHIVISEVGKLNFCKC